MHIKQCCRTSNLKLGTSVYALILEKLKTLFLAKRQIKFPKRYTENDNTTTVKLEKPA